MNKSDTRKHYNSYFVMYTILFAALSILFLWILEGKVIFCMECRWADAAYSCITVLFRLATTDSKKYSF